MRFQTGDIYNNIAVIKMDERRDWDDMEFMVQVHAPGGGAGGFTRRQITELHEALGEMLGLATPSPTSPLTASKPAKNPRRVNGGV